ncbi:MAG TPA: homocysteine S-methyltransferase family protein, partial [Spirochaetota bacterium]
MNILTRLTSGKPVITDGAMGTLLQSRLPGFRGSFELLNIEKPEIVEEIHRLYVDAGAELLLTNSFGGNGAKLSEYGLQERCREINHAAATVARKAAGKNVFVAGDMSATGHLVVPMGDTPYETVYNAYTEQVIGLTEGGADLLVIETMSDLQETLIALRAAKDHSKLPVLCSMTFEENGSTISGTDIITGLATLAAHGADIIGANCSLGPVQLYDLFSARIDSLRKIGAPLSIWSNAGLPKLIDGKTVFPLGPDEFAVNASRFINLGFSILGGCCGTTPAHIKALADNLADQKVLNAPSGKRFPFITSRYTHIDTTLPRTMLKIGERLNPTARKAFAAELKEKRTSFLFDESRAQVAEGADVLDLNVGVPGIDEIHAMRDCVTILANTVKIPVMIDSDNATVIEEALKLYPGCAIVNSING